MIKASGSKSTQDFSVSGFEQLCPGGYNPISSCATENNKKVGKAVNKCHELENLNNPKLIRVFPKNYTKED